VGIRAGIALAPQPGGISRPDTPLIRRGCEIAGDRGRAAPTVGSAATVRPPSRYRNTQETEMGHHDQDPGHGEPGHVHDENWNRHMMETDDPQTNRDSDTQSDAGRAGYVTKTDTVTYLDDDAERDMKDADTVARDR
jgi:hypothetical protein